MASKAVDWPLTPNRSPNSLYLYPRHLDFAISLDAIKFYQQHEDKWAKRYPGLPHCYLQDFSSGFYKGTNVAHWLRSRILSQPLSISGVVLAEWTKVVESVRQALTVQARALYGDFPGLQTTDLENHLQLLESDANVISSFTHKSIVLMMHENLASISIANSYPANLTKNGDIQLCLGFVLLHSFPRGGLIVPFTFFLGVLDNIESQFTFRVYTSLMNNSVDKIGLPYKEIAETVHALMEECYQVLGNEAAKFFKLLEPLSVGAILEREDPSMNSTTFLADTLNDLAEEKPAVYPYASALANLYRQWITTYGEAIYGTIIEQYGQEKLHLYPIVQEEEGLVKMYRFGSALNTVDYDYAVRLAGMFTVKYIINYYQRHNRLPPMHFLPHYHPSIRDIIIQDNPQSVTYCLQIPLDAWAQVRFQPHHEFNYFGEATALLDDKAITPPRDYIYQLFAQDALDVIGKRKPYTQVNTKLVLEILDRPVIDIRAFYQEVEELGVFPPKWAVIQLMAKERELKIDPREFSILVFEARMMCSTTEKNIVNSILPYFQQQTMTASGAEIRNRIDSLVTLPETDDHVWISFVLDLEQWNYQFRPTLQVHFTNILNEIFDVKHFHTVTKLFPQSTLFSSCKFTPPGFPGTFHQWNTHAGGNQGIFQKLWTLITIVTIEEVMLSYGLDYQLIGAGDNQVLFVRIPKSTSLGNTITSIKTSLATAFQRIGLALKKEETWHSKDLTCYQRKYYYKGSLLPNGMKSALRAFAGGTDISSGLLATITTSMSGGLNIAETISDPYVGPLNAYLETYTTLALTPRVNKHLPSSTRDRAMLSLFTTGFGYLPFAQFSSFMYMGHKDPTTESLAVIRRVWDTFPELRTTLAGLMYFEIGDQSDESRMMMIIDPFALNIRKPLSIESVLKSKVDDYLLTPGNVKNEFIKSMLNQTFVANKAAYLTDLLAIRPIDTGLMHALLEASSIGQVMSMSNAFNRISSVVRLVDGNNRELGEDSFQVTVNKLDERMARSIKHRVRSGRLRTTNFFQQLLGDHYQKYLDFCQQHNITVECTFSCRWFLISLTYGLLPEIIHGPYLPSPCEQVRIHTDRSKALMNQSIILSPASSLPGSKQEIDSTRGPFKLLIGGLTKDPIRTLQLSVLKGIEAGPAFRQNMELLMWLGSTGSDQNVKNIVLSELQSKLPEIKSVLHQLSGGLVSGHYRHRFANKMDVMGCYQSGNSQLSTWYQISSNHAKALQRHEEDRFIFFQACHQHIIAGMRLCDPIRMRLYAEIQFDCCSYVTDNPSFTLPHPPSTHLIEDTAGLIFSDGQRNMLLKEINTWLSTTALSTVKSSTGPDLIAAFIGNKFARRLMQYQKGMMAMQDHSGRGATPQSVYNVTLLRKTPLGLVLQCIAIQIIRYKAFGSSNNVHRIKTQLELINTSVTTIQSVEPYSAFLDALMTAGRLPDLVLLAGLPLSWIGSTTKTGLLSCLMTALIKAVDSLLSPDGQIPCLIEVKSPTFDWSSVWRFMYQFSLKFRRWHRGYPNARPRECLEVLRSTQNTINLIVCTDVDIALAIGREKTKAMHNPISVAIPPNIGGPLPVIITSPPKGMLAEIVTTSQVAVDHDTIIANINLLLAQKTKKGMAELIHIERWSLGSGGACTKLIECFTLFSRQLSHMTTALVLADGPGSYSSVILHLHAKMEIVYNSKIGPEDIPHGLAGNYIPPCCICPCQVDRRLHHNCNLSATYGDLSHGGTWDEIETLLSDMPKSVELLTWDMEGHSPDRPKSLALLVHFLVGHPNITSVIKIYLDDLTTAEGVTLLNQCMTMGTVYLTKPQSSGAYNSELFLVTLPSSTTQEIKHHLDYSHFLVKWEMTLKDLTDDIRWNHALGIIFWSANLNICHSHHPSGMTYQGESNHPVCKLITDVNKLLMEMLGFFPSTSLMGSKSFQSVVHSRSRGTQAVVSNILACLSFSLWYLRQVHFPFTTTKENMESLTEGTDVQDLYQIIAVFLDSALLPGDLTHNLNILGELIYYSGLTIPQSLVGSLLITDRLLDLIPQDWSIRAIVPLLKPYCQLVKTVSHYQVLSPRMIKEQYPLFFEALAHALSMIPLYFQRVPKGLRCYPPNLEPLIMSACLPCNFELQESDLLHVLLPGYSATTPHVSSDGDMLIAFTKSSDPTFMTRWTIKKVFHFQGINSANEIFVYFPKG